MTTPTPQRSDPVGDKYYGAVTKADTVSNCLFYLTAALSIAVLFLDRTSWPPLTRIATGAFVVAVIALFVIGLGTRLYWTPRAEKQRRLDFFTSALDVSMTHQTSVKYYNNAETEPIRRMAAQLLENTHFTSSIALKMAPFERARAATYALIWLICVQLPDADLGLIAAATQAVFAEQIFSRWVRLEWMRSSCERIFQEVRQSFSSGGTSDDFRATTLNSFSNYEMTKAIAGVTLSSKIFDRDNATLSAEWESIKKSIGI
ncbi:MAG: hypothetical protein PSV40_04475 [Polaromonas sp.]|jgi:hypothetical protein|uniref:hypothetical protein n=1 Tax=Polaromonas sp. TaxID=1869339 RepID=UPI002487C427|nr:hypothetical protein [Polaromonas sp.]MDI1268342.1 hypothetical protein [Polaromonas sp.]